MEQEAYTLHSSNLGVCMEFIVRGTTMSRVSMLQSNITRKTGIDKLLLSFYLKVYWVYQCIYKQGVLNTEHLVQLKSYQLSENSPLYEHNLPNNN